MALIVYLSLACVCALILHRVYILLVQTSSVTSRIFSESSQPDNDRQSKLSNVSRPMHPARSDQQHSSPHCESEQDSVPPSPGPGGLVASQYELSELIRTDIAALPGAAYGSYVNTQSTHLNYNCGPPLSYFALCHLSKLTAKPNISPTGALFPW